MCNFAVRNCKGRQKGAKGKSHSGSQKKKKLQNRFQKTEITPNMKSKLLYVVIAANVLLLASCKKDSSSEEPSGRQTYNVA